MPVLIRWCRNWSTDVCCLVTLEMMLQVSVVWWCRCLHLGGAGAYCLVIQELVLQVLLQFGWLRRRHHVLSAKRCKRKDQRWSYEDFLKLALKGTGYDFRKLALKITERERESARERERWLVGIWYRLCWVYGCRMLVGSHVGCWLLGEVQRLKTTKKNTWNGCRSI